jgi:hypothetical protein
MNTTEFKQKLQELTKDDNSLRPFVCDGNPLHAEIFIVGINPATSMKQGFWDYYTIDIFDRKRWLNDYKNNRKDKRTELSPTRAKIEKLIKNEFSDHLCLETNLFSKPTSSLNKLEGKDRNTDVFDFLIKTIRPKAVLIHGKNPSEFIKKELSVRFGLNKPLVAEYQTTNKITPLEVEWQYGKICICATRHFRLIKMTEIKEGATGLINSMNKKH